MRLKPDGQDLRLDLRKRGGGVPQRPIYYSKIIFYKSHPQKLLY